MAAFVQLDVSGAVYGKVTTLLDNCVKAVVKDYSQHVSYLSTLPPSLKDRCLYLMCKRGWLRDDNIALFLHDKVRQLDLADCDISDQGLQSVCQCTQLCKIDLNSMKESRTSISADGVRQLVESCTNLQTMYLRRCLNVTDVAVVTMSKTCPQLRLLNLGGCSQLTDASLIALGQNSKFLKSINVSHTQVTDNGVMGLVSGQCARSITELHINGCQRVTDESVEAVMQFCPQISIFLFHGCPNITEQSRQALEDMTLNRSAPMKQVTWTIY